MLDIFGGVYPIPAERAQHLQNRRIGREQARRLYAFRHQAFTLQHVPVEGVKMRCDEGRAQV